MSSRVNPITTEVIRNAFYATAEDMSAVLNRSSYSPVIYESHDYGISLFNEKVELLAQAPGTPYFTGGLEAAVQVVVDKFGLEKMREGDVFVVNDTYLVGAHLNDVDIVSVYFHDGKPSGSGRSGRTGRMWALRRPGIPRARPRFIRKACAFRRCESCPEVSSSPICSTSSLSTPERQRH